MSDQTFITADWLGDFRRELIAGGFSADEAFALCRDALSDSLHAGEGVRVRASDPKVAA